MNLFIDDVRTPEQADPPVDMSLIWTVACNYDEALKAIVINRPQRIAFDHDLSLIHYSGDYNGKEKTGYDLAKQLVDLDMNYPEDGYITKDFQFSSHSANPDGKRRIENLLRSYKRSKYGYET